MRPSLIVCLLLAACGSGETPAPMPPPPDAAEQPTGPAPPRMGAPPIAMEPPPPPAQPDAAAPAPPPQPSPEVREQCLTLINLWCSRFSDCAVQLGFAGTRPDLARMCQEQFVNEGILCVEAVGVSATYGTCLLELTSASCSSLFVGNAYTPPKSCAGVILLPPRRGGA